MLHEEKATEKIKSSTPSGKVKISVNIPEKLLAEVDLDRKTNKQDRSTWITTAVMTKLSLSRKEKSEETSMD